MLEQSEFEDDMVRLHRYYDKTSNPMFAWMARWTCREQGEPLPEWVEQYLDAASYALFMGKQSPQGVPQTVANALGFTGKGGPSEFRYLEKSERLWAIELIDEILASDPEFSIKEICRQLSGPMGKPWPTIERWYQRR